MEVVEVLLHFLLWLGWVLELHLRKFWDNVVTQLLFDEAHGDLLLASGGRLKHADAALVEQVDGLHHAESLVHGAVIVFLGEGVLLQELFLDNKSSFHDSLLILREGVLTNKLHNFSQLVFLLQNLLDRFSEWHEFFVVLVVVLAEHSVVVGEGNVPVNRWEMLLLSEFLIQTPENLHDGKGSSSNWIGEITTWWGDGTDD